MLRRLSTLDRDLSLICLSLFLWGLGAFLYTYIQPLYLTQLGATPEQVGLALGLGGLLTAVLYAPIGLWADRRGRKGVILAGWSLGTAAGYGFAFAPDWRWFIPAMAAYTLSNFAVSVLNGYIAARTTPDQRAFVFALISMGFSAGSIAAPAIGGWIGEQFGLRTVYLVAAVIFTLSTVSMLFIRPQPAEPQASASSARAIMRQRTILIHLFYLFLLYFAVDVGFVLAPKFLEELRGLTVAQIGWLGTISAIGTLILAPLISRFGGGGRLALAIGQLLSLMSLALLAGAPALPASMIAFFCGGGSRLVRAPALARFANLLTPTTLGFGLGLQQTASQFGLALSPYLAGILYAHNPSWPFYVGMMALVGTLGLTVLLPEKAADQEPAVAAIAAGSSEPAG